MQAIEISAQVDQFGNLHLLNPLRLRSQKVRLIILVPQADEISEEDWAYAIKNPAFQFLNEPEEDIYTIHDGQPIN